MLRPMSCEPLLQPRVSGTPIVTGAPFSETPQLVSPVQPASAILKKYSPGVSGIVTASTLSLTSVSWFSGSTAQSPRTLPRTYMAVSNGASTFCAPLGRKVGLEASEVLAAETV